MTESECSELLEGRGDLICTNLVEPEVFVAFGQNSCLVSDPESEDSNMALSLDTFGATTKSSSGASQLVV